MSAAPARVQYAALIVPLLSAVWAIYIWFFAGPRLTLVAHDPPPMHPPDSEDRPLESVFENRVALHTGPPSDRVGTRNYAHSP